MENGGWGKADPLCPPHGCGSVGRLSNRVPRLLSTQFPHLGSGSSKGSCHLCRESCPPTLGDHVTVTRISSGEFIPLPRRGSPISAGIGSLAFLLGNLSLPGASGCWLIRAGKSPSLPHLSRPVLRKRTQLDHSLGGPRIPDPVKPPPLSSPRQLHATSPFHRWGN